MKTIQELKREAVKAEIERRGLTCVPQGKAWHVFGIDVDLLVADLAALDVAALQPYRPRKQSREEWQN